VTVPRETAGVTRNLMRPTTTARYRSLIPTSARHLPLIGLLVLLALFGHDALKASHASAGPLADSLTLAHAASAQAADDAADHDASAPDRPAPRPSRACGAGADVAMPHGNDSSLAITPAPIADVLLPATTGGEPGAAVDPTIPPGVLRALLQVYRI
jgi:hypothetical protein